MKIAFLTPEYVMPGRFDGGLANYLRKSAIALVKRGCEVWVFVESDRDAIMCEDDIIVCEVRRCDNVLLNLASKIPFVRLFVPVFSQFLTTRKIARRFWNVHSKIVFDVIQASSYRAPGFALLNNGKVPVVCRVSSFTPCWRAAFGRKRHWGECVSDWLELRQARDADECFSPSRLVAKMYVQAECNQPVVLRTPFYMHENALDDSFFLENRPLGRYLLFFGTLSRIKGADLFALILPSIFEKHGDLSMVFIGRDDGLPDGTKVFTYIKSACNIFAERLYYHQTLSKAKLFAFVKNAEAVLLPSRVDNYPNVCLEAQMFGIPVIGTYDSSLDEMIEDDITGFLAKNGDAESFIEGIERCLCQSIEDKHKMRLRIQSHIKLIEREDRIGQLLAFYENAIKKFMVKHEIK
jgi:glycosyltransferase involved in cell wall biosynthesis